MCPFDSESYVLDDDDHEMLVLDTVIKHEKEEDKNQIYLCSFHEITPPALIRKRYHLAGRGVENVAKIDHEFTSHFFESECERLMSNAFTLNSAEQSPTTRHVEQRTRTVQRRLNISQICVHEDCTTPEKSHEELSFYSGNSPQQSPGPCPISPCDDDTLLALETSPPRFTVVQGNDLLLHTRRVLNEDEDPNSMDSGYHTIDQPTKSVFQFVTPLGTAPRKTPAKTSPKTNSIRMFHSLSSESMESNDDDYMELFEMENVDDDTTMPTDLCSLLSGDIKAVRNTPEHKSRPIARRSLSMNESNIVNRARNNLFDLSLTPERQRQALTPITQRNNSNKSITPYSSKSHCFKRPEPPTISPVQSKRYKYDSDHQENIAPAPLSNIQSAPATSRPLFKKSISMNDSVIMTALSRSHVEPNLIGDFSKPFVLPLMEGKHSDLKSISCDTMARLLHGDYEDTVASFKVIDCRYPYEYEGGHIRGAINLFMQEQVMQELMDKTETTSQDILKRNILVFHCEFSSERGPKLSRFLRNNDRLRNENSYPALIYPEVYLLHGGYKDFYGAYPELCDPCAYRPMLEPEYTNAYKHFRAKTRSWSGDSIKGTAAKGTLVKSRSRLVL